MKYGSALYIVAGMGFKNYWHKRLFKIYNCSEI